MHEFKTTRRIEFVDTDMGGIVHFSRYFVFMETAEHQFLEAIGSSVDMDLGERRIGWPRVAVSCEYRSPARFGDELEILLRVVRKGRTSLTYEATIRCGEREIARGRSTSVCCELQPGRDVVPVPIPGRIADRIEEAPQ